MNSHEVNNEPLIFKELPKDQRKTLKKEFYNIPEVKKRGKLFIIVTVIFAMIMIASAIIGLLTSNVTITASFSPLVFFCVFPAIMSQQKFEKWLETEKNIVMKRKK